jgi:hypothetical protein
MSRQDFDDDDDEEEDEDIDALIDELESQDGDNADYEEEEADQPGGARVIPEELLQTDTRMGLNSAEVLLRRKKFGYNQLKGSCISRVQGVFLTRTRGKGKAFCQIPHVLCWSNSIRHGGCCHSRRGPSRLG